ncbi:MAG: BlaI/MecI/CopY family transcriptional regulator [Candidatus Micrarchaeia archaeon]
MVKKLAFFKKNCKDSKGLHAFLSPLECDVSKALWSGKKSMRVRQIHTKLKKLKTWKKIPLTSVAVILDRLYEKGIVTRTAETGRGGTHYLYSAKKTKKELEYTFLDDTVNRLLASFGPSASSYFNERFSK